MKRPQVLRLQVCYKHQSAIIVVRIVPAVQSTVEVPPINLFALESQEFTDRSILI
jgi:hypothetical protein